MSETRTDVYGAKSASGNAPMRLTAMTLRRTLW